MTMRIHFVGVKGTGMSALAQIATTMENAQVTGSDVAQRFFTDTLLEKANITVLPFAKENIDGADLVVASAAYAKDHVEIARAHELGIPVLSYPQYLGRLMDKRRSVCITGTHGKTTTTAMTGLILRDAKLDPTIVVGSDVPVLGGNAYAGSGDLFVAESCEYRRHFLNYNPEFLAILNMELDHPDYFKDLDDVLLAFKELAAKVPAHGQLVIWGDDAKYRLITSAAPQVTYGFMEHNDYRAVHVSFSETTTSFEVLYQGNSLGNFSLGVTGKHNVLNALASIALSSCLGVSTDVIRTSLGYFTGTKRRFERLGEFNGALIMDDYAHHPTEISVTLEGARLAFPDRKLLAVFQPHTFSRTERLLEEFSHSFGNADEVIIADIFASAREQRGSNISAETLAQMISANGIETKYLADLQQIKEYLSQHIDSKYLVITMGAGDIYKVGLDLVELDA
jgi:UDP-N-acetylmuramate--alanine ligase